MIVRPFHPADREAVNALHASVWWPERSDAGWDWLEANPARIETGAPSGWVVADRDDRPVAFVGNLVQRFRLGEARFHAASGFSIIVSRAARGRARNLIRAVQGQPGVFATYTLNANPGAARLYPRQGLSPWPPRTHDLKLSWMVDPLELAQGRLLRTLAVRAPGLAAPHREHFMNRRLRARGLRRASAPGVEGVERLSDVGPGSDYDVFWRALADEGRLIADRSPETMAWRLSDPDRTDAPVMLAWRAGDETRGGGRRIGGYAMAMLAKTNPIEPASLEIIDLVALDDEPRAIPALMAELMRQARALGAAKLRLQVVSEDMLRRLGPWTRRARREGGWGHCWSSLRADAPPSQGWQPTPFDGDYGVCQRPTPLGPTPLGPTPLGRAPLGRARYGVEDAPDQTGARTSSGRRV